MDVTAYSRMDKHIIMCGCDMLCRVEIRRGEPKPVPRRSASVVVVGYVVALVVVGYVVALVVDGL